jgi:predicted component of type VI protein secretion system
MEAKQQLALMDKIIRELDDLKNSQTSVLKKISQIEADNINLGVDVLNDALPGIHEEVDDAVEKVTALIEQFREHRNKYETENQKFLVETP